MKYISDDFIKSMSGRFNECLNHLNHYYTDQYNVFYFLYLLFSIPSNRTTEIIQNLITEITDIQYLVNISLKFIHGL